MKQVSVFLQSVTGYGRSPHAEISTILVAAVDLFDADRGDGAQSGFGGACETRLKVFELRGKVGVSPRRSRLSEDSIGRRR